MKKLVSRWLSLCLCVLIATASFGCGAPAARLEPVVPPRIDVQVLFTQLSVVNDKEEGSGDWRITLEVDGMPLGAPIRGEAGSDDAVELNVAKASGGLVASHRVSVGAKVEEWDGGFDNTWEQIGEKALSFTSADNFGIGEHAIEFDGPEGHVLLRFLVVRTAPGDPLLGHAPTPTDAPKPASSPAPPTPSVALRTTPNRDSNTLKGPYRQIWSRVPNGGWAKAAVFTQSGDLATLSGPTLSIHARHDGKLVEAAEICRAQGPKGMRLRDGKLYIACPEKVVEVSLPGLAYRVVLKDVLKGKATLFRSAAFGGDRLIYAHNDGTIEVYSTDTWKLVTSKKLPSASFAPSIAVAPDGRNFLISNSDGKTRVFGNGAESEFAGITKALVFNPDGTRVFGSTGSFRAGEMLIADRSTRGALSTGSWISDAAYFSGGKKIAVAGSDGLVVKDLIGGELHVLDGRMTAETVAATEDGKLICSADRGDRVACFASAPIAPSTYKP